MFLLIRKVVTRPWERAALFQDPVYGCPFPDPTRIYYSSRSPLLSATYRYTLHVTDASRGPLSYRAIDVPVSITRRPSLWGKATVMRQPPAPCAPSADWVRLGTIFPNPLRFFLLGHYSLTEGNHRLPRPLAVDHRIDYGRQR